MSLLAQKNIQKTNMISPSLFFEDLKAELKLTDQPVVTTCKIIQK